MKEENKEDYFYSKRKENTECKIMKKTIRKTKERMKAELEVKRKLINLWKKNYRQRRTIAKEEQNKIE